MLTAFFTVSWSLLPLTDIESDEIKDAVMWDAAKFTSIAIISPPF
jgi:hypothetical protein